MIKIQTTTRLITVKETIQQIEEKMNYQWINLTEDNSFFGEMSNKSYIRERKIKLNRDYIVEIYEDYS